MANRLKKDAQDLLGFKLPNGAKNEFGLTEKEEAFCQHYVREANAALAARLAGYPAMTAGETGYEYLRKPHITSRVQALRLKVDKGYDGMREKIIGKLMVMADVNPQAVYNDDGTLKPISEWDLDTCQSINSIETTEDLLGFNKTKKLKMHDKIKALEVLNKMQGYNAPDKIANTDPDGNYTPAIININIVPPPGPVGSDKE